MSGPDLARLAWSVREFIVKRFGAESGIIVGIGKINVFVYAKSRMGIVRGEVMKEFPNDPIVMVFGDPRPGDSQ